MPRVARSAPIAAGVGPAVDLLELLPDAVAAVLRQPVEALGGPDRAGHRGGVAVLVVLDPGGEPPLRPQDVVGLDQTVVGDERERVPALADGRGARPERLF